MVSDDAFASLEDIDVVVIDVIAPMEVDSPVFERTVRASLDSSIPVVEVNHQRWTTGFIAEVKAREDGALFQVSRERRDQFPQQVVSQVVGFLDTGD